VVSAVPLDNSKRKKNCEAVESTIAPNEVRGEKKKEKPATADAVEFRNVIFVCCYNTLHTVI